MASQSWKHCIYIYIYREIFTLEMKIPYLCSCLYKLLYQIEHDHITRIFSMKECVYMKYILVYQGQIQDFGMGGSSLCYII